MGKKILPILVIAIILISMGISTTVLAKKSIARQDNKLSVVDIFHQKKTPITMVSNGIAVDTETLETKPVIFLEIKYKDVTNMYLISDKDFHKLKLVDEEYNWETETKIFKYETGDGKLLTVVIQKFDNNGLSSISGIFDGLIINFEPIYGHKPLPRPLEIFEESATIETIENETGISISAKHAKPIEEWIK